MRNIDSNLLTALSASSTSICELFRVTATAAAGGGTLIALTSHAEDVTVTIDSLSVTFKSRPGLFGSQIASDLTMAVDHSEVGAYLVSSVIDGKLLYGQRVDGARFERFIADYDNPSYTPYRFHSGFIGEIPINDKAFKVGLRSLVEAMHQPVGVVLQPGCRAGRFGEVNTCNFPLMNGGTPTVRAVMAAGTAFAFRATSLTVASVLTKMSFTVNTMSHPTKWFSDGVLEWIDTTNQNDGVEMEVRSYTLSGSTGVFVLQDRPGGDIAPGDTFMVDAGCNRTASHCFYKARTTSVGDGPVSNAYANGNIHNYQGELHLTDESEVVKTATDWDIVEFLTPAAPSEALE